MRLVRSRRGVAFAAGIAAAMLAGLMLPAAFGGVGDPQVRTNHPWYPGELACSTFERLFATQADLYEHVTGSRPVTDEEKALAAWLWRNTHYFHAEEGAADLWNEGFRGGRDQRNREYWTGLFAHGFGLCGTTHSQWTAEMQALLGHGRGRGVGVTGHNSFEVFLTGGAYETGRWALLDHDLSTVIFDTQGGRLLSIAEVTRDWSRLTDRRFQPEKQRGWPVCGLHPDDGGVFRSFDVAEYLAGYAGPPPMVRLRRGETLTRFPQPGLDDGRTFVFWGRNMGVEGVPGPERSRTWVNQPETLHGSLDGAPYRPGQARYGNAVFRYRPDFATGDYREGVVDENDQQVTFEFTSPYVIAATPPNDEPWGIYDEGGTNGLVITGRAAGTVSVSTDRGSTWHDAGRLDGTLDLTDHVKGHQQYRLRFSTGATRLAGSDLTIVTVCQANPSTMPRLTDDGSTVTFAASGRAVVSAGPNLDQAARHVIDGRPGTPRVTLELAAPRGEPVIEIHAAAHVLSGNPPDPQVTYTIEFSTDRGQTWQPLVENWSVSPRGENPPEHWSQSLCYGSRTLASPVTGPVQIRFRNDGGRSYARCEAHLVVRPASRDDTKVHIAWTDDRGDHEASRTFPSTTGLTSTWTLPTGRNVATRSITFEPVAAK